MAKKRSRRQGESSGGMPRRKVTKTETYHAVQAEFLQILKQRDSGTVDLIHDRLDIPADAKPRIGRAIAELARQGRIEKVEFRQSGWGIAHGRNVFVWKLIR